MAEQKPPELEEYERDCDMFETMLGMFAYDTGCVSSGIRDEVRRDEIKKRLHVINQKEPYFRLWFSRNVRKAFLDEDALKQGYGMEDVKSFITWLSDYMGYDL